MLYPIETVGSAYRLFLTLQLLSIAVLQRFCGIDNLILFRTDITDCGLKTYYFTKLNKQPVPKLNIQ